MRKAAAWGALLALAASCGCVRRTLTVTSRPPGARVTVNGQPAGRTPVTLGFSHHGVYRLELRKEGYRPVLEALRLGPKPYEYAGVDFVSEVLWPGVIRDRRKAHYQLVKSPRFEKKKLLTAARRAAAEAERVIPELYAAPRRREGARDQGAGGGAQSPVPSP